ncbi:MAG: hypothetical protein HKN32_10065, partial [Flavobacteriales bacterium]|nr:hypothetical protein [Flavobacteriales bacterium]
MRKGTFVFIIALMAISLIGIIGLQWHWIGNAIDLAEDEFDQGVARAMSRTVDDIERDQTELIIRRSFGDKPEDLELLMVNAGEESVVIVEEDNEFRTEVKQEEEFNSQTSEIRVNERVMPMDEGNHQMWTEKGTPLSAGELVTIRQVQTSDTSYTDTLITQAQVNRKIEVIGDVVNRIFVEEFSEDIPIEERLATVNLDSLVASHLASEGIDTPFLLAVSDLQNEKVIPSLSNNWTEKAESPYATSIYPFVSPLKGHELLLEFPSKDRFVWSNLGWPLSASLIFTLVIVLTFGLTIFY